MKRNIQHKLINWVKGMKVSKDYMEQTENYFIDMLCDAQALRLSPFNYGLLPNTKLEGFIDIRETGSNIEVELKRCNALTAGGCRISYNPEDISESMYFSHNIQQDKEDTNSWDVVIRIDPFKRVATGIPNERETPPRHPDALAHLQVHLLPNGHIKADDLDLHHLIIGRVQKDGNKLEIDTTYIPPCTCMSSHAALLEYYSIYSKYLDSLMRVSRLILSKIYEREKSSPIALRIEKLCITLLDYLAVTNHAYRTQGKQYTPLQVVNTFAHMAQLFRSNLYYSTTASREELLKYFYEWGSLTPGAFENVLAATMDIRYSHNDIRPAMVQIESFLKEISSLWETLGNLQFIGEHKDNIIISERVPGKEEPKTKGGWSILD